MAKEIISDQSKYNTEMNKQVPRKRIFFNTSMNQNRRYQFKLAWGSAPHPDKVWKGGEDALYVSKNIIIVADGVGGWITLGIDAGVYARKLIQIAKQLLEKQKMMYYIDHPEQLAIETVQKNQEKGSATLSIITLHPLTGMLKCYHIGDSVFGFFRKNQKPILAEEQQKAFNVPFQVFGGSNNQINTNDSDSDDQKKISDVFKGCYNQYSYSEIQNHTIVLASDGLWDNIHLNQISEELFANQNGDLVQKIKNLIKRVKDCYKIVSYESPFYKKALEKGKQVPKSSKVDDISIILAEIIIIDNK